MRSEVAGRPVFRRILYSQAWEDPDCDRAGLAIGPGDDVLAVAASGDNALAFVLDGPRSVTAIDFNATQLHLLELKVAAIECLEPDDVHRLLGVREHPGRAALYRHVRDQLSEGARGYWDRQAGLLQRGVIHVGRFEGFLQLFHRRVLPLIHRRRLVDEMLAQPDLAGQARLYREAWDTWRWRGIFRLFFSRFLIGRLGRDPAFFAYVEEGRVGERFRRRAEHALTELPVADNWFVEYMLRGRYDAPERRLPPYLRPEHHALLRERARDTLRLVAGSFEELLPRQPEGAFSCFYLSDVFEWMSGPAFVALLRELHRVSRDGGRMTWRNLLVPRGHPAGLEGLLEHDAALSERLRAAERAFVYGDFVVERVRKAPEGAR